MRMRNKRAKKAFFVVFFVFLMGRNVLHSTCFVGAASAKKHTSYVCACKRWDRRHGTNAAENRTHTHIWPVLRFWDFVLELCAHSKIQCKRITSIAAHVQFTQQPKEVEEHTPNYIICNKWKLFVCHRRVSSERNKAETISSPQTRRTL